MSSLCCFCLAWPHVAPSKHSCSLARFLGTLRGTSEIGSSYRDLLLHSLACLPGLTVWPKVIWGTLADVAIGSTGLAGTHRLVLTWVQVTHISAVVTIVT